MRNSNLITKILIVETVVAFAWAGMTLIFTDFDTAGFYFWGGFVGAIVAFLLCIGSLFLIQQRDESSMTEINAIPVWISLVYLSLALVVNSIFIFIRDDGPAKPLVISNVVLFVLFFATRMYTENYAQRVEEQAELMTEKTQSVADISARIGIILGMTTDNDVKKKLLSLKEMVNYSTNINHSGTEQIEAQFIAQLRGIEGLIHNRSDKQIILQKIDEASAVWKNRNSIMNMIQ